MIMTFKTNKYQIRSKEKGVDNIYQKVLKRHGFSYILKQTE